MNMDRLLELRRRANEEINSINAEIGSLMARRATWERALDLVAEDVARKTD